MAETVGMPRLSDSMEEGTVLKWLVEEGGEVKRGEPLVEIETDKANMTYESDTDGVLVKLIAKEGDTLAVGEPIAEIGAQGEAPSGGGEAGGESAAEEETEGEPEEEGGGEDDAAEEAEADEESAQTATAESEAEPGQQAGAGGGGDNGGERVKASPVAKRMARELGVELARLEGSGPGGRIVKADVESAAGDGASQDGGSAEPPEDDEAEAAKPQEERASAGAKGEVEVQELTRLQQTVTRRMAESKATAPDFALTLDVDMTAAVELRRRLKEVADPAPSFNDMIVKAAAAALREFPKVNGAYRDGRFELYEKVNVGIAVAAEGTLVVPTIFSADGRSLGDIAKAARGLIEKVREGNITPPEVSGGTFTISNLGMFGIERFTAIINPPQAALLTVGALERKPAVDDRGRVVARDQLTLTLVCDHRILYGADGAQFLARVRELLEQPLSLAL
jgi:pyruvate dehydrogenase E2 component (dihydrolipoamide acetyltransferase)